MAFLFIILLVAFVFWTNTRLRTLRRRLEERLDEIELAAGVRASAANLGATVPPCCPIASLPHCLYFRSLDPLTPWSLGPFPPCLRAFFLDFLEHLDPQSSAYVFAA